MKDIFIDNCIAKNFTNPLDPHYKDLVRWLVQYNPTEANNNAVLVLNKALLMEYKDSNRGNFHATCIVTLIDALTRQGRINNIEKKAITDFINKNVMRGGKKKKTIQSNQEDWPHIASVLLSHRRMALTTDQGLTADLRSFAAFAPQVSHRPEEIGYAD